MFLSFWRKEQITLSYLSSSFIKKSWKIRRETCIASECSPLSYKNSKTVQVATKMEGVKSETKASVVHCDNIF